MKQRILVVDDSKVHTSIVTVYLMKLDVEIDVASSPKEALAIFDRTTPDLVVTDMLMPDISGLELARMIKERSNGMAGVILISGSIGLDPTEAIAKGEIDEFVPKPLDGEKLLEVVNRVLRRRRSRTSVIPGIKQARVLCGDDSKVGQRLLRRAVTADESLELVGMARDAGEVLEMAKQLSPDLVLLDPLMPGLDAEKITRRLVTEAKVRVAFVSEEPSPHTGKAVYAATAAGALDVLAKPRWSDLDSEELLRFHDRVKELAEIPIVTGAREEPIERPVGAVRVLPRARLVCICGSTGAPSVLARILARAKPAVDTVPVLVVQHLLASFESTFQQWLAETAGIPVVIAEGSEPLTPGRVVVAPAGAHLVVAGSSSTVSLAAPVDSHRPSGTLLFRTAAQEVGNVAAVMLSGLGADGVDGLSGVRAAGGAALVQAPNTCPAPSMPEAAIERRAADRVLAPDGIADLLVDMSTGSMDR